MNTGAKLMELIQSRAKLLSLMNKFTLLLL